MTYAPQTLSQILAGMFGEAAKSPGIPVRKTLGSKLQIDVVITTIGITKFQISRTRPGPSSTEWTTVLKNLPYKVEVDYKGMFWEGRTYFSASWPTPPASTESNSSQG